MGSGFTKFINWLILIALILLGFDIYNEYQTDRNNARQMSVESADEYEYYHFWGNNEPWIP